MRRVTILALAAALGCAASSSGQETAPPPPRPRSYQGIFGGAAEGANRDRTALSMSVCQAYDDDLAAVHYGPPQSVVSRGGFFDALVADFTYQSAGRRRHFTVNAGTSLRFYPDVSSVVALGHYVGVGFSTPLWRGSELALNQTAAYAPSYWYRLFPAARPPDPGEVMVANDYATTAESSGNYGTSVVLTAPAGRRNTLRVATGGHYTDYLGNTALRNLWDYDVSGAFSRGISRNVHLSVEYVHRRTTVYGAVAPENDVTVGVDVGRRLSATRAATLSASFGAATLQQPTVGASGVEYETGHGIIADVAYTRQFGRTWEARGAYRRGFSVIQGIATPLYSNGATATAEGFVSRAVDLTFFGSYAQGDPSLRPTAMSGFTTYTGSARARVALNATWAAYVEYVYYYYDFRNIVVPPGIPPTATRNAARVGMTMWVPFAKGR